ncbi:Neopullulanase SusA [Capnocytophaga cynodegmi]|uniref:Neopullulanase SusA n=2 Tax=Capnocytophaga cynodegmi TaxID=28189 RepID=A0A0B7HIQ6_9FLAO|nr:Neopullulanase SusA [Capnocytophaga cynodegmi]CEN42146.1 Neopullulanase SusA [Capnocytophaga cynodegmi]
MLKIRYFLNFKFVFFAFYLTLLTKMNAQIQKIEPPFWWADMKNTELQIMLYGNKIANFSVESDLPITNITKTENPNYLFLTVDTKNKSEGNYKITLINQKRKLKTINYELKKRRDKSALRKGFDSSDVIYLLMPDRFANGNPNNDSHKELNEKANRNLPGGRHGGDIQGIIKQLDYIKSLGATAIWSTPMCEDNDETYSYHTYGQSDVYKIDPRYGTNQEYKQLAEEMHKRGMKLIKDYVTNHWGWKHWMINDLPTYDWIHQFPGYAQSNYRMSTQMDNNTSEIDKKYCVDGWFVQSMPDLNQSNPLVLKYLTQNAIWWIEYADLDGLRVDTYSYNDKEGIAKWTKAIMNEYPNFNIVGEVWLHDQAQISYWQKDSPISAIQSYNTYLPSVMDFTLHDAIGEALKATPSWDKGMIQMYDNFVNDFLYKDINNILIFAENHDTSRINEIYQNTEDYKLIMTLLATARGIPQLYYGSEIGMRGDKSKGDAYIRQDFPGGWEDDKQNAFNPSERTELQKEYFNFTAKIFNWRKEKPVIHYGKTKQYLPNNEVYVYFRYNQQEAVMIILNNNKEKQNIDLSRFAESLKGYTKGKDIISGKELQLQKSLEIEGKTSMIIELR